MVLWVVAIAEAHVTNTDGGHEVTVRARSCVFGSREVAEAFMETLSEPRSAGKIVAHSLTSLEVG